MPASVVQICNLALAKIGSPSITALDEDSREARACSLTFPFARDEVLQLRPWASCVKRIALTLLDEAPAFEFTAAWQLPADFLELVRLGDDDNSTTNHRIEGRLLLTSTETANIIYTYRNEDTATYEPVLVDLIASRMAIDLALMVANSSSLAQGLTQLYEMKRQRARAVDGRSSGQPAYTYTSFVDSRG